MARRKKQKQAEFKTFENCFDRQAALKGRWHEHFGNNNPIYLELGCGKAAFSLEMARRYPGRNFVGIDLKADRLWYAAKLALEQGLNNLALLQINLLTVGEHFADNEVDEIWITFPDPFPKKRQAKHRMINPQFLRLYELILRPGGRFHLKTDNLELFHYTLEILVRQPHLQLCSLSFDLHEDELIAEEAKIKTAYEEQFLAMGKKINYLSWKVNA